MPKQELEQRNVGHSVAEFVKTPLVRELLRTNEATWLANPASARMLDLAFRPKKGGQDEFLGLELFETNNCVGVVFCEEGEEDAVWQKISQDSQLQRLLQNKAKVAILSLREVDRWRKFYDQIEAEGIWQRIGVKAGNFSGLKRLTPGEHESLLADANGFFYAEAKVRLEEKGVAEVAAQGLGKIDVAFLDGDGRRMAITASYVRIGELRGEILLERVIPEPVWVPGLIMRGRWENKREAYERAWSLKKYYQGRFKDRRVEFPVISPGQISLWRKLGMGGPLESSVAEVRLSAGEVIKFLYLGESNIEPGELAGMGLSLPGSGGEFPGLDIVFYKRDEHKNRQIVSLDGFLGLSLQDKKLGKPGLEGLGDVKGIVIVPDEWNAKEMQEYTKLILKDFNYRTMGAGGHILFLTPSLFAEWQKRGSAFLGKNGDYGGDKSLGRKVEYGYGISDPGEINLAIFRQMAEVGNQKSAIEEKGKEGSVWHLLDWGASFTGGSKALQELTAKEPTSIGIRRSLEIGALPMKPGFYDIEYLLASARNNPKIGYIGAGGSVTSFLRAELVKRSSIDELARVVGNVLAKKIFKLGEKDVGYWYRYGEKGDQVVADILLSHAHVDHAEMSGYIDCQARSIGSAETIRHLLARAAKGSWRSRVDRVSLITQPRERGAYRVVWREMVPMYWSGQTIRLSSNLNAGFYFVDHSIGGTTAIDIQDSGGQGLVVYSSDIKPGLQTERAISQIAERQHRVLMVESTNIEDGFKPSTGVTEAVVKGTLEKIVAGAGLNTLVAIIPPNHLKRLETVMEIADNQGRVVAIDPSIAEVVEQLRVARDMEAPLSADGFKEYLPELGEEVALWWPPTTQAKTYRKILRRKAEMGSLGVVDSQRLSKQGSKLMVVTTPYRILRHDFGGVFWRSGLEVIYLSYYPYQQGSKYMLGESLRWVNEVGRDQMRNGSRRARMYMDFNVIGEGGRVDPHEANYKLEANNQGLHASGHATFPELIEIIDGMLGGRYKGKTIVLVHGEKPVNFAHDLKDRLGARDLRIISNLKRYHPASPINKPGFSLRLG